MGYTTEFIGRFELDRPLDDELFEYLNDFSETRRMARNFPNGEYGVEGEFYVDGSDSNTFGAKPDDNVIDYNTPPKTQPGLWCDWAPTDDGKGIEWNGREKFYNYVEWLEYIIANFLAPKGYVLNGQVQYQGEDIEDQGVLSVKDNILRVRAGVFDIDEITQEDRIKKALDIARCDGGVDGDHHKMWAIDQMVRALTGCPMIKESATDYTGKPYTYERQGESEEYLAWVKETQAGEDGPETYLWDEGTPP